MVRPREFDRDDVLKKAMKVFWAKGFAATSTDDLLEAMGIGRQSLYNSFGDKKRLYVDALAAYQNRMTTDHLRRLSEPESPLEGIYGLLAGLVAEDTCVRGLGCMGVSSVSEFGTTDKELVELRDKMRDTLDARITERIKEGQVQGEIEPGLRPEELSAFVQLAMSGLQLAARGGGGLEDLRSTARFVTDRLRAR